MLETFTRLEAALGNDANAIVIASESGARDAVANLVPAGVEPVFIDAATTDHFGFIMALNSSQNATTLVILNMHAADESVIKLATELLESHSYAGRELAKLQQVVVTLSTSDTLSELVSS